MHRNSYANIKRERERENGKTTEHKPNQIHLCFCPNNEYFILPISFATVGLHFLRADNGALCVCLVFFQLFACAFVFAIAFLFLCLLHILLSFPLHNFLILKWIILKLKFVIQWKVAIVPETQTKEQCESNDHLMTHLTKIVTPKRPYTIQWIYLSDLFLFSHFILIHQQLKGMR